MYDNILDALRRGDHARALDAAREAVAAAPGDAQAHRLLAVAQAGAGEGEAALDSLQRALRLAPDDPDLHLQLAGLLLGAGRIDDAGTALRQATGLDPNQFEAYVLQAQLALGRGDLAEAERQRALAARAQPGHPWVDVLAGHLALRRGDAAGAQAILARAAQAMPDDPQVLMARGFAFLAGGHDAFAEQAFRRVVEVSPRAASVRGLLAEVLRRQGRFGEAADAIEPLLSDPATATPALRRQAGELHLANGDAGAALPQLRAALADAPADRRTLSALLDAWAATGQRDEARDTLDAALQLHPWSAPLWQSRIALEGDDPAAARALLDVWLQAQPDAVDALEARMRAQDASGEGEAALATAQRILELEPGRTLAEIRLLDELMQSDPAAAVERVEAMRARAQGANRDALLPWLGYAQHVAGRHADALATWHTMNVAAAPNRLPLYAPGAPGTTPRPADALPGEGEPPTAFLWGPPGSGMEDVAAVLAFAGYPLRDDRLAAAPPPDALQDPDTIAALREGRLSPAEAARRWIDLLPARGVHQGIVVDWLLWWDNALVDAIRQARQQAQVLFAVRDPRDMLLEWIAFGGVVPWAVPSAGIAADWLAATLAHAVELQQGQALHCHVVRTDHAHQDIAAFAGDIGSGLGVDEIRVPPPELLAPRRLAGGAWRAYRDALAEPFAALTPVAIQLGYAAD